MEQCPTCGREFSTEQGMKVHHTASHGESLKRFEDCEHCGKSTYVPPSRFDNDRYFCSQKCQGKWRQGRTADEFGVTKTGVMVECSFCGDENYKKNSRLNLYDNHYCNRECMSKDYEERLSDDGNPRWEGGQTRTYPHDWDERREKVIERDSFECQMCNCSRDEHRDTFGRDFHVHHIQPICDDGSHEIENLITLCLVCHPTAEKYGGQISL